MNRSRWAIAAALAMAAVLVGAAYGLAGLGAEWWTQGQNRTAEAALNGAHAELSSRLDLVPIVTAPGAPDTSQTNAREFCEAFQRQLQVFSNSADQLPVAQPRITRSAEILSGACGAQALQSPETPAAVQRKAALDFRVAARQGLHELQVSLAEWRRFESQAPEAPGYLRLVELLALLGLGGTGLLTIARRQLGVVPAAPSGHRMPATESVSGQWMRTAMEAATEGIMIVEPDGRIRSANAAAERALGFARGQLMGLDASRISRSLVTSAESCEVLEQVSVRNLEGVDSECQISWFRRKGVAGAPTIVFVQSAPTPEDRATAAAAAVPTPANPQPAADSAPPLELDAAAFSRLENEILQLTGYAEIALSQLPLDAEARGDLERVTRAAARAALLCREAAPAAPRMLTEPLGLNAFMGGFEQRLLALLEPGTDVLVRTDAAAGNVDAESSLLEQALLSLILQNLDQVTDPRLIRLTTSPGRIEVTLATRGVSNPGWRRLIGERTMPKAARWLASQGATLEQDEAENGHGLRFRIHMMPLAPPVADESPAAGAASAEEVA